MGLGEWVKTSQVTEWAYTQVLYLGCVHRSLPCGQYKHSHCKQYPDISVTEDMHETPWADMSILESGPTCARVNAGGSYPFPFVLFFSPFLLPWGTLSLKKSLHSHHANFPDWKQRSSRNVASWFATDGREQEMLWVTVLDAAQRMWVTFKWNSLQRLHKFLPPSPNPLQENQCFHLRLTEINI